MSALPTRPEMMANALASLRQAQSALSDARDWLNSDWRPAGTALTDAQADARSTTRRVVGECKVALTEAQDALSAAIRDAP